MQNHTIRLFRTKPFTLCSQTAPREIPSLGGDSFSSKREKMHKKKIIKKNKGKGEQDPSNGCGFVRIRNHRWLREAKDMQKVVCLAIPAQGRSKGSVREQRHPWEARQCRGTLVLSRRGELQGLFSHPSPRGASIPLPVEMNLGSGARQHRHPITPP